MSNHGIYYHFGIYFHLVNVTRGHTANKTGRTKRGEIAKGSRAALWLFPHVFPQPRRGHAKTKGGLVSTVHAGVNVLQQDSSFEPVCWDFNFKAHVTLKNRAPGIKITYAVLHFDPVSRCVGVPTRSERARESTDKRVNHK